jgi:hypothetical protein
MTGWKSELGINMRTFQVGSPNLEHLVGGINEHEDRTGHEAANRCQYDWGR